MPGYSTENIPRLNPESLDISNSYRKAIWIAITVIFALSCLDLAGWVFNVTLFENLIPQWIPMNTITAICFVLAATALTVIMLNISSGIKQFLPYLLAFFICILSLINIYSYIISLLSGHKLFLKGTSFPDFFLPPGMRMTFITACNFFLVSFVLLLLSINKTRTSNIAHAIIIPVILVSYFLPVSYILGVYSLKEMNEIGIALNTDISFCAIGVAVLIMRPESWFLKVFSSGDTGSLIARKLIPSLILIPIVIGWLKINGVRAGLFNHNEGVAIVTITYTVFFLVLVWITARSANKVDRRRHISDEALKKSLARMEILSEIASELLKTDTPQNLIHEICSRVMKFLDCQIFSNFLVDHNSKKLRLNSYEGISVESAQNIEWMNFEVTICGSVFRTGKNIVEENIPDKSDPLTDHIKSFGIEAYACFPLISQNKIEGTLSFGTRSCSSFSEEDLSLMKVMADHVAIALAREKNEEVLLERETQLIELNATKDKFFNIVAHDLKNPFTSLLGSSELLYDNIDKLEKKNIRELSTILNDSAKSGYAILQNLLDWSRSQTNLLKINPERLNLISLINENISTLKLQASNKKIKMSFKCTEDIFVFADKNMINTILRNILSNAVKFTYKSGEVIVSTTLIPDEVIVSVKDTGIGIPEEKIDKLFRLDVRNSMPGTENEQGTGLGLKLSKEFVEKLGGRIWIESVENKGSDFRFSIPLIAT